MRKGSTAGSSQSAGGVAVAVVPLKIDSQRLPNKNFLHLGDRPLAHYVIETLIESLLFDEVFIYCSDPGILGMLPAGVSWLPRPRSLDRDEVLANELFDRAVRDLRDEVELAFLVQVTSPFLTAHSISKGLRALRSRKFDTAIAVQKHRTYAWVSGQTKPLNYDPKSIPRTQALEPLLLETSGFYGFRRVGYLEAGTRVHGRVKFVELSHEESVDIDYPEDFVIAEKLLSGKSVFDANTSSKLLNQKKRLSSLERYPRSKPVRHVVFDLDGVLIDSLSSMETAWTAISDELNLGISFDMYRQLVGLPFVDILRQLEVPPEYWTQVTDGYFGHSAHQNVEIYDGAQEAVFALLDSNVAVSIFTSKPRKRAAKVLESLGWSSRVELVSPEDIPSGRGKPAPDGLLWLVASRGFDPSETLYVGDMKADWECARRAGVPYIHASWGYGQADAFNTPTMDSLAKLVKWALEE